MSVNASEITAVAVYPSIGIARVGNAPGENDFILASKVIGGLPIAPGGFRDENGHIMRQAVRFRIYARTKSGNVVEIISGDGVQIEWRVTVANLKAGWYEFTNALDLPGSLPVPAKRRNADIRTGRSRLDIRPPPQSITGPGQSGPQYRFEGHFFDKRVYLGELRTDDHGRLIFLGGRGVAAPRWPGTKPTTFANNTLWHDDVCDGPVRARVSIDGISFEATPGYVVAAPPNYAPGLFGVVTMDDVVAELFQSDAPDTARTEFTRDIWPIFARLTGLQWVNHGFSWRTGSVRRSTRTRRRSRPSSPTLRIMEGVARAGLPPVSRSNRRGYGRQAKAALFLRRLFR